MDQTHKVVLTFHAKNADDEDAELVFGPCTEEEGFALCDLLDIKHTEHEGDLIEKLSGVMNADTRSHVKFCTDGFSAGVVSTISYNMDIVQVTKLLGS